MQVFVLVDCNNFFVSCERVFNFQLMGKPVIVLSNNDGCAIARSNESKALGIKMGAPYFEIKDLCKKHNVRVFSSNYQLYADMSSRVMQIIAESFPNMEIYSVDEAFIEVNVNNSIEALELFSELRSKISQYTGIPVSIGISYTKTLAKVAGDFAKKNINGICALLDHEKITIALRKTEVGDIWGIGRKLKEKLVWLGINNAFELKNIDRKVLEQFSIVMQRLVFELNGTTYLSLEDISPKKSITCSRSFGHKVENLDELQEAISEYASKACQKLRAQESLLKEIYVFASTTTFETYGLNYKFEFPTEDTREVIKAAKTIIQKMFKSGIKYRKVGIIIMDLIAKNGAIQMQLFDNRKYVDKSKSELLMKVIDMLNKSGNKVKYAAQGITCSWKMKNAYKSPHYTTQWKELLQVF